MCVERTDMGMSACSTRCTTPMPTFKSVVSTLKAQDHTTRQQPNTSEKPLIGLRRLHSNVGPICGCPTPRARAEEPWKGRELEAGWRGIAP